MYCIKCDHKLERGDMLYGTNEGVTPINVIKGYNCPNCLYICEGFSEDIYHLRNPQ